MYQAGERESGEYAVDPDGKGTIKVYCDMVTDGGGGLSFREGSMAQWISTETGPATKTALVHCRASSGWGMKTSID